MPLPDPNRRTMLAGLAAGLLAPAMACRGAGAAEQELRFPHAFGVTVMSQPARRVVSLGYTTQDTLLALDVVPVGIRDWFGDQPEGVWPWAQPYLKNEKPVLIKGNVSLEVVAALKPDLVIGIGSGISQAEYTALSRLAPVLMQPAQFPPHGMPWDELTRVIGHAVGKDRLAEERVSKAKAELADIAKRHPDWAGLTAVAAYHYGGETGVFASSDTRGRVLTELGFKAPAAIERVDASGSFYQKLSPEDLSALDADLLVWVSSVDQAPDLVNLPMRRILKAHLQGREVFAGGLIAAAMSFGSILSLPFVAAELEADIAAAIDGNPATKVRSALSAGLAQ